MAIEHAVIPDAQRHEAKGADTASNGEALFANGDGTTTFRGIDFTDVSGTPSFSLAFTEELNAGSTTDQTVSTSNTPLQITFGGAQTLDNVAVASGGNVTFLTDGTYVLMLELATTKISGASGTRLFFREVYDGVEIDKITSVRYKGSDNDTFNIVTTTTVIEAEAGKVYSLWMASDTNNTVGLVSDSFTVTGWGHSDTYSAHLRVYRFS